MKKENIESTLASYIKEHFNELSFTGRRSNKICGFEHINISIDRPYVGKGNYSFGGRASICFKADDNKGQMLESFDISGESYVEEGNNSPLVSIVGDISIKSMNGL